MKTIGILGGLGPQTTANLYLRLVALSEQRNSPYARVPLLVWSVPLKFALEEAAIVHGHGLEQIKPLLIDGALRLQQGGAEVIILACNSLHVFIEDIREAVSVPVLSIVEETIAVLVRRGVKRVALLGTGITVSSRLYAGPLQKQGIECIAPAAADQRELGRDIYTIVSGGVPKCESMQTPRDTLGEILKSMVQRGVTDAVLACTDLKLLIRGDVPGMNIWDSLEVLTQAAHREAFLEECNNEKGMK